jgi:general secretion pathway protein K
MSGRFNKTMRNQGVALILALFAVIILTALVVTFAAVARTDVLLAGNRAAMLQAFYGAQSSLNYCRSVLAAHNPTVDTLATETDWVQGEDGKTGAVEWQYPVSTPAVALDIPGFTVTAVIEDESARLNINTLNTAAAAEDTSKAMLMALPGMTDEAADSILDWRDANEQARPVGAESEYYLGLASPYEAANAPFQTLEEVRLVRGVDSALFDGDGTDALPGLKNLVTIRSGERNVDGAGRRRTEIASSTWQQVAAAIPNLTASERTYLQRRWQQQGAPRTLRALLSLTGVSFRKLAQALDRFYAAGPNSSASLVQGTVNLNTASAPVLQAIGLSADEAQAVINQRATAPLTKDQLANLVSREHLIAVADSIATKSAIFRVRAFAQAEDRPIRVGVIALVDCSGQSPTVILWRQDDDPSDVPSTAAPALGAQEQANGS